MTLFEQASIDLDMATVLYQEHGQRESTHARVMIAQCAEDTYGLIICEVVDVEKDLSANPPNVLMSSLIFDDVKVDFSETDGFVAMIVDHGRACYIKFADEISYWTFVNAITGIKSMLAARRVDLDELLDHVISTVPTVDADPKVPPRYEEGTIEQQ